ncbi:hypothetical protein E1B28_009789 [Marasmius oreades]|uniref:Nucleolar pre-ribosomal-associated protein 1 n=1 Tax=Marasmius oreades TaxID=181124 RepID=A0A9P7UQU2_9AGAR|nr:uncharacterized protein E1B28_009789 [Marasmius oreades]KAG7090693.1 hypothetical protein E1B28_009789 [Marasmius oreades]
MFSKLCTWITFNRLLNMRRKGKADSVHPLARPDIRTLTLFLVCSFLCSTSALSIKTLFFDQHSDKFLSVFKGLVLDPYVVVRKFLETCWESVWCDVKIPKKIKVGLFGEITVNHLLKLYGRTGNEGPPSTGDLDEPQITADLVHHFLLAICTRPGQGICFRDSGWYSPSEVHSGEGNEDQYPIEGHSEDHHGHSGRRVYNKILKNVLKSLKPNEDLRQQELTMRILGACPELVAGYWAPVNLTLEPRLSSRWIGNVALFKAIISLPIPEASFFLSTGVARGGGGEGLYNPTPPPLGTIMDNILPSAVNSKAHFSKGLQPQSINPTATASVATSTPNMGLVQLCTAQALCACLSKYAQVRDVMRHIADTLEESSDSFFLRVDDEREQGQWRKRLGDLEREVRKRVPDFQVVVSFVGRTTESDSDSIGENQNQNQTKAALLSEVAHRLLCLYQQCLPEVTLEARYDFGKLLGSVDLNLSSVVSLGGGEDIGEGGDGSRVVDKLRGLKQVHVLRLLTENEQFKASWSGKAGNSKHTNLYILLKIVALAEAYSDMSTSPSPATPVVTVLTKLLKHILSDSIIFRQSEDEIPIWLSCLPTLIRSAKGSESPDGASLTDEIEAVVAFVDECVQRCVKTPYRYIDDLRSLEIKGSAMVVDTPQVLEGDETSLPSPLLMAILEQLRIKVNQRILPPSDVLGIMGFVKKLLFKLSVSTPEKSIYVVLGGLADKFVEIFSAEGTYKEYPVVSRALVTQAKMTRSLVRGESVAVNAGDEESTESVKLFLDDVEKISIPSSKLAKMVAAFELVDWIRLIDMPLRVDDVRRVVKVVSRLHPPALNELLWSLPLVHRLLWDGVDIRQGFVPPFELLFRHSTNEDFSSPDCRENLRSCTCVFMSGGIQTSTAVFTAPVMLISRALENAKDGVVHLLRLLQNLLISWSENTTSERLYAIKRFVFTDVAELREWFTNNSGTVTEEVYKVLGDIVSTSLFPADEHDRNLGSDMAEYWVNLLKNGTVVPQASPLAFAWIQYISVENMFALFDLIVSGRDLSSIGGIYATLLKAKSRPGFEDQLKKRMEVLVTLSPSPSNTMREELLEIGMRAALPLALDGYMPVDLSNEGEIKMIEKAENRWKSRASKRLRSLEDVEVGIHSNVNMMSYMLYNSPSSAHEGMIRAWLEKEGNSASLLDVSKVCFAYLDVRRCLKGTGTAGEDDPAIRYFARFVEGSTKVDETIDARRACSECVSILLGTSRREGLAEEFEEVIAKLHLAHPITVELMEVGVKTSSRAVKEVLINRGLQWIVRVLTGAGEIGSEDKWVMVELENVLQRVETIKPHVADPVLIAVIQHRLSSIPCLRLLQAILSKVTFKPLIVNRHLQTIVQSPQFHKACREGNLALRNALASLLHILFHLHPSNTCQTSHVEPLLRVYRGTLSVGDQKLLDIFRLFEKEKRLSVTALLAKWSPSDSDSSGPLEALKNLDGAMVLRTCLRWPQWRRYEEDEKFDRDQRGGEELYDPVFLILLGAHAFASDPPKSAVDWVEVMRTNILGLMICALSSRDRSLRNLAATPIATVWKALEGGDMLEKPHVIHVLSLFRDALVHATGSSSSPSLNEQPRLPSHTTLLLTHALRGIFYPSNFIYPLTARFLLQRPQLDINDLPMLYAMLYSSNAEDGQWKRERIWMLKFLADGLRGTMDWKVFKRRHTWDLIASLFGAEKDRLTRRAILEVLSNLTCISQATTSLLLKSSLLSWIEIQLLDTGGCSAVKHKQDQEQHRHEITAWIKIFENILIFANRDKLDDVTRGEWRVSIGRCLERILQWCSENSEVGSEQILAVLHLISRLMLRLIEQCPEDDKLWTTVGRLLKQCIFLLRYAERDVLLSYHRCTEDIRPLAPHGHYRLFEVEIDPSIGAEALTYRWSGIVEELWRVSMSLPTKCEWDALTCRLLVSRSLRARDMVDGIHSAEWARREVIRNMHDHETNLF